MKLLIDILVDSNMFSLRVYIFFRGQHNFKKRERFFSIFGLRVAFGRKVLADSVVTTLIVRKKKPMAKFFREVSSELDNNFI